MIEYKTVSLADQVYDTLEYNILTGVYACGESEKPCPGFSTRS